MNEPIEQTRGIDTLVPHPRNYNQHPPAQIERLAASLQQFGQVRPIVVHRDTIIAGHGVYMAAQHLGYSTLRATQLPDDWTDEQAMAYLVTDNETRRGAEPDDTELAALLDELQQQDFDIAAMGFDEVEYDALLDGLTPDLPEPGSGGDEFEPDDAAPCRVQAGDVWLLGGVHRLICGDCTDPATVERLMQGERADMVWTDPPYGVGYAGGHFHSGDVQIKRERERLSGDTDTALYDIFLPMVLPYVDGPLYMWFADTHARDVYNAVYDNHCEVHALIIWHKINATYAAMNAQYKQRHEPCLYFKPKGSTLRWCGPSDECTLWEIKRDAVNEYHPTQKPIALPERAICNHDVSLVLDPFLGSGTTIIAAHRTGRRCYGCEISPEYCEIILQRCEAEGLTVEKVSTAAVDESADSL
jgi:DNA modification methylase